MSRLPIGPATREMYREYLAEKRRRVIALCDAARDYLNSDTDHELAELEKPVEEYPDPVNFDPYGPWTPTVEELARASESVQNLETQIEKLESIPADGPAGEYLSPLINGMYRPMLETQLATAREYRDRIQKRMEDQAAEKAGS